jgi:hypothetical protein
MEKAKLNRQRALFYQEIRLKFKEETIEVLHLEHCMLMKRGLLEKWVRNTWKVLTCGAGD